MQIAEKESGMNQWLYQRQKKNQIDQQAKIQAYMILMKNGQTKNDFIIQKQERAQLVNTNDENNSTKRQQNHYKSRMVKEDLIMTRTPSLQDDEFNKQELENDERCYSPFGSKENKKSMDMVDIDLEQSSRSDSLEIHKQSNDCKEGDIKSRKYSKQQLIFLRQSNPASSRSSQFGQINMNREKENIQTNFEQTNTSKPILNSYNNSIDKQYQNLKSLSKQLEYLFIHPLNQHVYKQKILPFYKLLNPNHYVCLISIDKNKNIQFNALYNTILHQNIFICVYQLVQAPKTIEIQSVKKFFHFDMQNKTYQRINNSMGNNLDAIIL